MIWIELEAIKLTVRYDQRRPTDLEGQEAVLQTGGHQNSGEVMSAYIKKHILHKYCGKKLPTHPMIPLQPSS